VTKKKQYFGGLDFVRFPMSIKAVSCFAKLSYGVYMWHLPVIIYCYLFQDVYPIVEIDYGKPSVLCIFLLIVVSISFITHELVEKPVTARWKKRLAPYLGPNVE